MRKYIFFPKSTLSLKYTNFHHLPDIKTKTINTEGEKGEKIHSKMKAGKKKSYLSKIVYRNIILKMLLSTRESVDVIFHFQNENQPRKTHYVRTDGPWNNQNCIVVKIDWKFNVPNVKLRTSTHADEAKEVLLKLWFFNKTVIKQAFILYFNLYILIETLKTSSS